MQRNKDSITLVILCPCLLDSSLEEAADNRSCIGKSLDLTYLGSPTFTLQGQISSIPTDNY